MAFLAPWALECPLLPCALFFRCKSKKSPATLAPLPSHCFSFSPHKQCQGQNQHQEPLSTEYLLLCVPI